MDPANVVQSSGDDMLIVSNARKGDFVDAKSDVKPITMREEIRETAPIVYDDVPMPAVPRRKGSKYLDTPASPTFKVYPMNGARRGKVIIFNHVEFDDEDYAKRIGTGQDVDRLYATLPQLGFQKEDILVLEDYSVSEIQRTAMNLKHDEELKEADCLIVIILTHGEDGDYLMARDGKYHLYEFIENFTPTALNAMAGKPKLFIVQACRGKKLDRGVILRAEEPQAAALATDHVDSSARIFVYPEFADFLIVMSSHHGHYSFRNETGSWLIQELCNVIEGSDLNSSSIYDILTDTNDAVAKRISNADNELDKKKQISSFYSTLTKRLFFKSR